MTNEFALLIVAVIIGNTDDSPLKTRRVFYISSYKLHAFKSVSGPNTITNAIMIHQKDFIYTYTHYIYTYILYIYINLRYFSSIELWFLCWKDGIDCNLHSPVGKA